MSEHVLHEPFGGPALDRRLAWLNEPARWSLVAGTGLRIAPDAGTDFWQRTHYGFRADSGHALLALLDGDLVMTTHVRFAPVHQYDQAGLMVRFAPECWLKTSIEHEPDGPSRLGVVVTNGGYSDWSTQDVSGERREAWLRVRRHGSDYHIEASADGRQWSQLRVAHLAEEGAASWGVYACSPRGGGYVAEFSWLRMERAGALDTHPSV